MAGGADSGPGLHGVPEGLDDLVESEVSPSALGSHTLFGEEGVGRGHEGDVFGVIRASTGLRSAPVPGSV